MNEAPSNTLAGNNQHTAQRLAQKAHEVVDKVAAQADMAEQRLREACTDAGSKLQMSGDDLKARYGDVNTRVSSYIHEHPLTALGVAFGAGVLLAALMRR